MVNMSDNEELRNALALQQNQSLYREKMVSQFGDGHPSERLSGFPMPELYNQHYINRYSFPKGLIAGKKMQEQGKKPRQSIYDLYAQPARKGVSGWKLTKRVLSHEQQMQQLLNA